MAQVQRPVVAGLADDLLQYLRKAGITDAERRYSPYTDATDLQTRRVVVVPATFEMQRGGRDSDSKLLTLEVHVQQHVDPSDSITIDALVQTIESIWSLWMEDGLLRKTTLNATYAYWYEGEGLVTEENVTAVAKWLGTEEGIMFDGGDMYDIDTLRDDGIFASATFVKYRIDT